ncbi:ThiF family adenylyltransferase [Chryseobacterium indologenes]|uniref:HesA/MoeB/ThiF family protein n=1 Tax=Chryseobacterium indologenes TaxID=253 RepID=UPI0023E898A6|nr:ThiF family adenylyltransferase [Chryseobacterium indologenes]WET48155.1 ThiF family adenylyltransferase [Chryseobacterium indologenes]
MDQLSKLKLRPSVAIVAKSEYTEFFLSNIRKSIVLKMNVSISDLLFELDGSKTTSEWVAQKGFNTNEKNDLGKLLSFLNMHAILIDNDINYDEDYDIFPRVFTLLEDFFTSKSQVQQAFNRIKLAKVMIIGLGSVGSWVTQSLLMSGVKHFVLVDPDKVDLSNIHRQVGFTEEDIGKTKVSVMSNRLKEMNPNAIIECHEKWLDDDFFENTVVSDVDLIINCADYPTVDKTTMLIGEYCMKNKINHIIGGGYNLHQSLIGQVVIPNETACVECFRIHLDEINEIDTSNIHKLNNPARKVGSFPPLSSLSASITANEAFKILAGLNNMVMNNSRTEFMMRELNFSNLLMNRRSDCKWCGNEGKYYQLSRNQD